MAGVASSVIWRWRPRITGRALASVLSRNASRACARQASPARSSSLHETMPPDIRSGSAMDGKMLRGRFSWGLIFENLPWRCQVPGHRSARHRVALLDQRIEPVQIDGLDQMMMESDIVTAAHIFFHAKSRER